jgi:phosphatidylserine/phosphatidylglycerophosphate/cardiolipin synthase-like enzyme
VFKEVYRDGRAPLRYALMEKLLGPGVRAEDVEAATAEMVALRRKPENLFAVGSQLSFNQFDRWLGEKLTGLNTHVKYIHTKFMVIDPLGEDPIVVTGSANFSAASTNKNDENMLLIRGNQRVADIYLGEYMRLWDHYAFREWATRRRGSQDVQAFGHLDSTDSWWGRYFGDGPQSRRRQYFAG